jgi:hypothetical protein
MKKARYPALTLATAYRVVTQKVIIATLGLYIAHHPESYIVDIPNGQYACFTA